MDAGTTERAFDVRAAMRGALALTGEMNRTAIARGALVDPAAADAVLEVAVRCNLVLDALTEVHAGRVPGDAGAWLDAIVDGHRRWFATWLAREAS